MMTSTTSNHSYAETRHKHSLVRREPGRGLLAVLLRPDEPEATRDALRAIGFTPEAVSAPSASTWIADLDRDLALLHAALGPDALFDLGFVFRDVRLSLEVAPPRWPGRFVIHVGGTQRCVVFADAGRADLESIVQHEIEDYFVNEWAPATE